MPPPTSLADSRDATLTPRLLAWQEEYHDLKLLKLLKPSSRCAYPYLV